MKSLKNKLIKYKEFRSVITFKRLNDIYSVNGMRQEVCGIVWYRVINVIRNQANPGVSRIFL
jgi:hypothetical protein